MNRSVALSCMVFVLIAGCTERTTCPHGEPDLPLAPYIDDVIYYAESEGVGPISWTHDEIVFDLSEMQFCSCEPYNAIRLAYWTPTSCDHDIFVVDQKSGAWHQIAFGPPADMLCFMISTRQYHSLLPSKISLFDLIGREQILRLRLGPSKCPAICCPVVHAISVNPHYHPIGPGIRRWCSGLDWHGGSIWVSSREARTASITRLSVQGAKLDSIPIRWDLAYGLAFDGSSFWAGSTRMSVYKLNLNGEPACSLQLDIPGTQHNSMTWGDHALWLSVLEHDSVAVYRVDALLASRGQTTPAVSMLKRFPSGYGNHGIAWTGRHLLVAGDEVYRVTPGGRVVYAYHPQVRDIVGLAWDGEAVWLIHRGPHACMVRDQVISRFLLR